MVPRSALSLLLVACSQSIGGCWAGPILLSHDLMTSEHKESGLWPRSLVSASNRSMWIVIAIMGVLLLISILAVILVRKHNQRHKKSISDEESGFGQNPGAQPRFVLPAKAYDGVRSSQSPPSKDMVEDSQRSRNAQQAPPPVLIVSPPDETGQKPRRVPVPHLTNLSPSFRLNGLPPSPRLVRLPPSNLPSPHINSQQPSTPSAVSGPSGDLDRLGSNQLATSQLSRSRSEVSLSADSVERTMMKMERELRVNEEHRFRVPKDRYR